MMDEPTEDHLRHMVEVYAQTEMYRAARDRQLNLIMFAINDQLPGIVCCDTQCKECTPWNPVPHMANDHGNHPHPYGVIETSTHKWVRKSPVRDWVVWFLLFGYVVYLSVTIWR